MKIDSVITEKTYFAIIAQLYTLDIRSKTFSEWGDGNKRSAGVLKVKKLSTKINSINY